MQGGALDRMLRTYPGESMATFCLVCAAVLCAVLGPVVREGYRLRLQVLVLGVLALALVVAYTLPNIPRDPGRVFPLAGYYARFVYCLLGIAAFVPYRSRISLRGASLVAGAALMMCGVYAGVKLSVLSKLTGRVTPTVSVELQPGGRDYVMQVHVRASALASGQYVLLELSYAKRRSWMRFDPDGLGQVDDQLSVPIVDGGGSVSVRSQVCATTCDGVAWIENAAISLAATPTNSPAEPARLTQQIPAAPQ